MNAKEEAEPNNNYHPESVDDKETLAEKQDTGITLQQNKAEENSAQVRAEMAAEAANKIAEIAAKFTEVNSSTNQQNKIKASDEQIQIENEEESKLEVRTDSPEEVEKNKNKEDEGTDEPRTTFSDEQEEKNQVQNKLECENVKIDDN